jgi:hypothetical protein
VRLKFKLYKRLKGQIEDRCETIWKRYVDISIEETPPTELVARPVWFSHSMRYAWFDRIEDESAIFIHQYRDGYDTNSWDLPVEWLWDVKWEEKARAGFRKIVADTLAKQERDRKAKEESDRREYERLKTRFAGGTRDD